MLCLVVEMLPVLSSPQEIQFFANLISRHIDDVESKWLGAGIMKRKRAAWDLIVKDFNAGKKSSRQLTRRKLQNVWYSLKRKTRSLSAKALAKDCGLSAIDKILRERKITDTPTKQNIARSQLDDESSSESDEGNENCAGNSSVNGARPSSSLDTVGYCPRSQLVTSVSASQDEESSPAILDQQTWPTTSCPSQSVTTADQHGTVADQIEGSFSQSQVTALRPIPSAVPTFQPRSEIPASPVTSLFCTVMSPHHTPIWYQGAPVSAEGSSNSLPQAFRTSSNSAHTAHQHHPVIAPVSQSPLRIGTEEATRMQYLKEAQTDLQIRQLRALSAMEKTLYENKMRTEEFVTKWAKELHEARMQANATTLKGQLVVNEILLKRDEEFHLARMRTEETTARMQRELHDLNVETAKMEREQAETNRRIVELKLQKTEMELEQFKERRQGSC